MATQIKAHLTAKFGHFLEQGYLDFLDQGPATPTAEKATPSATQAINNQSAAAATSSLLMATPPFPDSPKTENMAKKTFVHASAKNAPQVQKNTTVTPYEKSQITPAFIQKQLCENPYHFYAYRKELLKNAPEVLGSDKLHVCPCARVKATDRTRTERATMDLVQHFHPTDHPFTIVSVGAGNCYQELVHIAKLHAAGYKDLHLVVIDKERMPIEELRRFCDTNLPPCHIQISAYASLEAYESAASGSQNNLKPNLLLLMDLSHIKVGKNSLLTHAFEAFQTNDLLHPNAVVAYSQEHARNAELYFDIVTCGLYNGDKSLFKLAHVENQMSARINQDSSCGLYQ